MWSTKYEELEEIRFLMDDAKENSRNYFSLSNSINFPFQLHLLPEDPIKIIIKHLFLLNESQPKGFLSFDSDKSIPNGFVCKTLKDLLRWREVNKHFKNMINEFNWFDFGKQIQLLSRQKESFDIRYKKLNEKIENDKLSIDLESPKLKCAVISIQSTALCLAIASLITGVVLGIVGNTKLFEIFLISAAASFGVFLLLTSFVERCHGKNLLSSISLCIKSRYEVSLNQAIQQRDNLAYNHARQKAALIKPIHDALMAHGLFYGKEINKKTPPADLPNSTLRRKIGCVLL